MTFPRYAQIKELRVKYGSSVLQLFKKEDLFLYHNLYLDDPSQAREDRNVHGNVPPPRRNFEARAKLWFKVPLHLMFFQDDMSKALDLNGLTQKLLIEVDFEPASNLIQIDGTSTNVFLSDSSLYYNSLYLQAEIYHVLRRERDRGIARLSNPEGMRLLFDNTQWHTGTRWDSTENLDGTVKLVELKNLSMPTKFLAIMCRWTGDLNRTSSASGASDNYGTNGVMGGADYFNVSGWAAPLLTPVLDSLGPAVPLFTHIALKSGSNYILRKTPVEEIMNDYQGRWFRGTPGLGVLLIPLAHLPTLPNACTGFLDFSVIDTPMLEITKSATPNGGYANVGAYAAADIGDASSGLQIDAIAFIHDNIDFQSYDAHRPF